MISTLMHPKDDGKLIDESRNLILKNIVGAEKMSFNEVSSRNGRIGDSLASSIRTSATVMNAANNLLLAARTLEQLVYNGMLAKVGAAKAAGALQDAMNEWQVKGGEL